MLLVSIHLIARVYVASYHVIVQDVKHPSYKK